MVHSTPANHYYHPKSFVTRTTTANRQLAHMFKLYFYTGRGIKASLKHNPLPCFARETLITTYSNFYVHSVSSVILLCSTEFSGFIFRKFSNFYYYKFFVLIFLVLVFLVLHYKFLFNFLRHYTHLKFKYLSLHRTIIHRL